MTEIVGIRGLAALVGIWTLALLTPGLAAAQDEGSLILSVLRIDDAVEALAPPFDAELSVELDVQAPVTNVRLQIDGGDVIELEADSPGDWFWETEYDTLEDLKTVLDGTWTLTIVKVAATDVISSFTVSVASLTDGEIFEVPTITSPQHGATDVDPAAPITWTDPSGMAIPALVSVEIENQSYGPDESGDRQDDSLQGSLSVSSTSYTPSPPLLPGVQEGGVVYFATAASRVGAISTSQGTIDWVLSPFAPMSYPDDRPLFGLGSEAIIGFGVTLEEDFEGYAIQSDDTGLLIDDGEGGTVRVYSIFAGPGEPAGSIEESLANGTGIIADVTQSKAWSIRSTAGSTGEIDGLDGFVLIGDLPPDAEAMTVGAFSDFFGSDPTARTPKSMFQSFVRLGAREASGQTSQLRLLMNDDSGNQIATDVVDLSIVPGDFSFAQEEFTNLVDSASFNFFGVVGISVELFTTPGMAPALELVVDDFAIDFVPEPGGVALVVASLMTLGWLRGARSRGDRGRG